MLNPHQMLINPDTIYEMLLDGSLKENYPEVFNLFGVPQNPTYHPEIDCGVHTVMALKQVGRYFGNQTLISVAILCHDFGKATTPKDILPKHIGHEVRGVAIAKHFLERVDYSLTKTQKDFVLLFVEHHTRLYGYLQSNIGTIVSTLVIFNLTGYFNEAVYAGLCDKMGRGWDDFGHLNAEYKNNKMMQFWKAINIEYIKLTETAEYLKTQGQSRHNFLCSKMTSCIKATRERYS